MLDFGICVSIMADTSGSPVTPVLRVSLSARDSRKLWRHLQTNKCFEHRLRESSCHYVSKSPPDRGAAARSLGCSRRRSQKSGRNREARRRRLARIAALCRVPDYTELVLAQSGANRATQQVRRFALRHHAA